jgi:uncharacterized protein with PQ loop repeat
MVTTRIAASGSLAPVPHRGRVNAEHAAEIVAVAGTVLAALFLVPQIVRLRSRRDATGLSLGWAALGTTTNAAWIAYLGALGHWEAVPAPALATVAYATTLTLVATLDRRRSQAWMPVAWTAALLLLAHVGGTEVVGPLLSVAATLQIAPAIVAVFRSESPSGVSPATWLLAVAEAGAWAVYGQLVGDSALLGYGLGTMAGSALIVGRTLNWRPMAGARS